MDGSNRVTARNRRFLRKIYPVVDGPHYPTPRTVNPSVHTETPQQQNNEEAMDVDREADLTTTSETNEEDMEVDDATDRCLKPVTPLPLSEPSRRMVWPPRNLSPQMRGKSHDFSGTD